MNRLKVITLSLASLLWITGCVGFTAHDKKIAAEANELFFSDSNKEDTKDVEKSTKLEESAKTKDNS